jgi:hypothetical protein
MNLELILTKEAFEALAPELRSCYKQTGEGFELDLTLFNAGNGLSSADSLAYARKRQEAGRVLHKQLVGQALVTAGLAVDAHADAVISSTCCLLGEDGQISVLVPDDRTHFRLSETGKPGDWMSLSEYVETLKPQAQTGGDIPVIGEVDRIISITTGPDGGKVCHWLSGKTTIDGRDASEFSGTRLMSAGQRPKPATKRTSRVCVTPEEAAKMSGMGLMDLGRPR